MCDRNSVCGDICCGGSQDAPREKEKTIEELAAIRDERQKELEVVIHALP
jgi:hypothetical protein